MTADNESRVEPGTGTVTGANGRRSSVPAVRVEGVVKRFGATVALDGAGLEVPAGMVFGALTFDAICPRAFSATVNVTTDAGTVQAFSGPLSSGASWSAMCGCRSSSC